MPLGVFREDVRIAVGCQNNRRATIRSRRERRCFARPDQAAGCQKVISITALRAKHDRERRPLCSRRKNYHGSIGVFGRTQRDGRKAASVPR
jgi:hypothetical protein